MKARRKLSVSSLLTRRTILIYTAVSILTLSLIGWFVFAYLNIGSPENALAAGDTFTSNRTGNWSTGSTWNGGTAPSTNLNGDNITINNSHSVTVSGTLNAQNNTTFSILGILTINGDLVVQNNLVLTITGSLIVNGTIDVKNGASITVNGGGNLTSTGDLMIKNNATVSVNGTMNIGGSVTFGANPVFSGSGTVAITGTGCNQWAGPGACSDNTTLPIELLSFLAESTPEGVQLNWKTASESNNDHFTLDRSSDGVTYTTIAEINGMGTTKEVTEYEHIDTDPITGHVSYYRLTQTDFDEKSETFKPVAIEATATSGKTTIRVYPNPITGNTLHVKFSKPGKGVVELVGSRGEKIADKTVDGLTAEVELSIDDDLKQGLYYLNYKTGTSTETVKLVK